MSVLGTYVGNLAQPVSVNLAGAASTDIMTATDDSLTAASYAFANDTGGAVTCYIYWYSAISTTTYTMWTGSVPANSTTIISDLPIRLREGDKIQAKGALNVRVNIVSMLNFAMSRG